MDTAQSCPGQLVDPTGPWARARVAQETWSTMWALRPGPDSPNILGGPRGHSDTSERRLGLLVEPTGNRTQSRVTRDSWSNPRVFGHGPESPWMPGLHRGPSEQGPTRLDSWSKLRALRPKHEWPRRAVRARRPSEPARINPGELIDTTGPRPRARVPRDSWSTTDAWSTQLALGLKHEWPVRAGRPRWPFETGASHLGELVDPTGPWKRARVPRESSSTEGPRTSTRVARDSWLTPRALVHGPESPRRPGRPRGHSDLGPIRQRHRVNLVVPQI